MAAAKNQYDTVDHAAKGSQRTNIASSQPGSKVTTGAIPVSALHSIRRERAATTDEPIVEHMNWLASIPSPSAGSLQLGPLRLNAYGLMIALGVVVATWLLGKRFVAKGIATRDDASSIAIIAVPAGVIGGRLYHVATTWEKYSENPGEIIQVWKGGLGIWGGITLGVIVGIWAAKRRNIPLGPALGAVAPSLAFAQAIGRWGNWFNQELFGRATTLPWGLEISDKNLPAGFESGTLFHPTFLYESIGCAVLGVVLLQLDRRGKARDGMLFAWYVVGYVTMRFFIEGLRIDPARNVAGLRFNQWTSIVVGVVAIAWIVRRIRRNDESADLVNVRAPGDGSTPQP